MFSLSAEPAMILRRFVVPMTGKADMTGEMAMVRATFLGEVPRVS